VTVLCADALELPPELAGFDRVLVDAPCSGLGVLNSRPDLRWRAQPLPELQTRLLQTALERVKPGGTVTYSVCTMHRAENEEIVDSSGGAVEDLGAEFPEYRHPRRPEFLLTLPHVHGTAGFFVARRRA
jgi:16S rRNA (cytosine967-C5)-methyltransferase